MMGRGKDKFDLMQVQRWQLHQPGAWKLPGVFRAGRCGLEEEKLGRQLSCALVCLTVGDRSLMWASRDTDEMQRISAGSRESAEARTYQQYQDVQ